MYRVLWIQEALDQLTDSWIQAHSAQRTEITKASHKMEKMLESAPFEAGESRANDQRILLITPLGFTYRVESDKQTVTILRVWTYRKRTK